MLRRHATGTSILLVVVLAAGLVAAAVWYLAARSDEYRAEAATAVVPVERLDDAEAIDAYAALDASGVAETLAAAAEGQANAELDDGTLSMVVVDGSSVIVATGSAENGGDAESIADDGITALGETGLLRGPFELADVTGAAGTATSVEPPWMTWAITAGAALVALALVQQLVARGLRRRHRRLDPAPRSDATTPAPGSASSVTAPTPTGTVANGAASNANGEGSSLGELSPITWSAPASD